MPRIMQPGMRAGRSWLFAESWNDGTINYAFSARVCTMLINIECDESIWFDEPTNTRLSVKMFDRWIRVLYIYTCFTCILRFLETHVSCGQRGGWGRKNGRGRYNVEMCKIRLLNRCVQWTFKYKRDETSMETDISGIDKTRKRESVREREGGRER